MITNCGWSGAGSFIQHVCVFLGLNYAIYSAIHDLRLWLIRRGELHSTCVCFLGIKLCNPQHNSWSPIVVDQAQGASFNMCVFFWDKTNAIHSTIHDLRLWLIRRGELHSTCVCFLGIKLCNLQRNSWSPIVVDQARGASFNMCVFSWDKTMKSTAQFMITDCGWSGAGSFIQHVCVFLG